MVNYCAILGSITKHVIVRILGGSYVSSDLQDNLFDHLYEGGRVEYVSNASAR